MRNSVNITSGIALGQLEFQCLACGKKMMRQILNENSLHLKKNEEKNFAKFFNRLNSEGKDCKLSFQESS